MVVLLTGGFVPPTLCNLTALELYGVLAQMEPAICVACFTALKALQRTTAPALRPPRLAW